MNTSGGNSISMSYITPDSSEVLRIQFTLVQAAILASNEGSTAICTRTNGASFDMTTNTAYEAFGVSYSCSVDAGCHDSLGVNINFYGSTVTYDGTNYKWAVSNLDVSTSNKGSEPGDGTTVVTTYGLGADWADWAGIPTESENVYLKCWGTYSQTQTSISLNQVLTLDSWTSNSQNFIVTASDYSSSGTTGESSGYMTYAPITLLLSVLCMMSLF